MSMTDLAGMRFAYSPLAEVAESLWMISSGRVQGSRMNRMPQERKIRAPACVLSRQRAVRPHMPFRYHDMSA